MIDVWVDGRLASWVNLAELLGGRDSRRECASTFEEGSMRRQMPPRGLPQAADDIVSVSTLGTSRP